MAERSLRLVADCGIDGGSLIYRGVERGLIESGSCVKAFEEDHKGMGCSDKISSQKCVQTAEVAFKRVEQGKTFFGVNVIEISSEGERVRTHGLGDGVSNLKASLGVKIGIASVHAHREYVRNFQVRLRAYGREVEVPVCVLQVE